MAEHDMASEATPGEASVPPPDLPRAGAPVTAPIVPYQALYRRFRPQRFLDVRGQDHVTRALRNSVRDGKVAHAYLFSGPRGTGKTSTARILAMALNCEAALDGEPDGTCTSCRSIRAGASMDVFELDAASNRKLDEMRDLLSRVALGTPGRWKVYIIDEVHQLTSDAASALLKTLEEPPSHVVFVLATTDPQRVLPTIQSRAQHFEFRLLDGDQLTALLSDINNVAGLGVSAETVSLAVQRGRGSARDAESVLEQLAAAGGEDGGAAPVAELAEALGRRDVAGTIQAVAQSISAGREPRRLGNDLVEHLRNVFLALQAPSLVLLPGLATVKLAETGQQMGLPFIVRAMETVGQALIDMRDSVDPRVTLEVALIRLASPEADTSLAAIVDRLDRLERSLGQGVATLAPVGRPGTDSPLPSGAPSHPVMVPPTRAENTPPVPVPAASSGPPATGASNPPSGPSGPRVALGAILKGGMTTSTSARANPSTPAPAAALRSSGPPGPVPTGPVPTGTGSTGTGTTGSLPTRDDLTKAWGDTVLGQLPQRAKAFLAGGRFVEVTEAGAVFALPDAGLLSRAANLVVDAETALSSYFNQRIPVRLVLDNAVPLATGTSAPALEPDEPYDLDDIRDAMDAPAVPVISPEQRILQAFPGAVLDS